MWRKIVRVAGFMLAVALIVAYICYASLLAQEHRSTQKVEKVVISLPDSSSTQRFTSTAQIRKHLEQSGLKLENELIDSVDAVAITKHIAKKGFVRDVDVYTTYAGELYIDIMQHKPVMRLLCGGMNTYVTLEGDVFPAPKGSAFYTAVVTGTYKPLFSRSYEGKVKDNLTTLVEGVDAEISTIEKEVSALRRERTRYVERIAEMKGSDTSELKEYVVNLNSQEASLKQRRATLEERKKKLLKKGEDFVNLTNFVTEVSDDEFWSAEVVQYVADTTYMGEISLRLVPRSGNFVIEFGTLNNSDAKLEKLRNFYDKGLSHMGWNRYKKVDIRYDKQIICTE